MSILGIPRIDSLAVAELSADFKGATISLTATAAFTDSGSGETHGWTKGEGGIWSKETMLKLKELQEAMERDLAKVHFEEGGSHESAPTKPGRAPGGIGEHLGVDAPPV